MLVAFMTSAAWAIDLRQGDNGHSSPEIKPPPRGSHTGPQKADTSGKTTKTPKLPSCDTIVSDCVDKCPQQSADPGIKVRRISPDCLKSCRGSAKKGSNCT
jgi:hypothetical protein